MKKVLLVLVVASVMVACNNKKKGGDDKKPADTSATTNTNTNNNTATPEGVPTFADAEVQAYVNDYTAFVNSYIDAYKAKDMTKVADLGGKYQEWAGKSMSVGQKLAGNAEETKKFTDYMTALSQKWADAAKAMVP